VSLRPAGKTIGAVQVIEDHPGQSAARQRAEIFEVDHTREATELEAFVIG
jgi:hypothetical protein